jgi:hypothetical protein
VDHRFNRARYDAEAVVSAFTGRLRQTVDLGTVHGDLVGAVHQAFPARARLGSARPGGLTGWWWSTAVSRRQAGVIR